MNLQKILLTFAITTVLFFPPYSRAGTYTNGDALLIFRSDGLHDVEFDLGSVNQFLGHPNGYTNVVTNWNLAVVTSNYSLSGDNVQFAVLATTPSSASNPTAWVSDSQPLVNVLDVTASAWQSGFYSPISATGLGIQNDPGAPAGTNFDVLLPTSHYAFDYIASDDGNTPAEIPYLGSPSASFKVTGITPTTVLFYAIQPTNTTPKPAATLIGSFNLNASGLLVFQAGPLLDATTITSVTVTSGTVPVTFNTKAAVKYRLTYSTAVNNPATNWTALSPSTAGDGTPHTLIDTSPTDPARFYNVESYP